jgi:hypothetical protein
MNHPAESSRENHQVLWPGLAWERSGENGGLAIERSDHMHVHANQFNPYVQMNAVYTAARAEAKMAAERTRKKLIDSAAALFGEADDGEGCVVRLSGEDASKDQPNQRDRQTGSGQEELNQPAKTDEDPFSGWA